ncbi:uncharacterized protein [Drosophila takahashii]|uniref:uncharacterized protein n=1 Tax=Drosophila takahashii TaxID=29030 RepID=UPI00389918CE
MLSKIHQLPFPEATANRANELLELIHADVCGPFPTQSLGGSKYFLTFIDDKSRRIFVYFLRKKDEVLSKFMEFKNLVERQTDRKLKCLRTDNGGEFVNKEFDDFLRHHVALDKGPRKGSKFQPKGKEYTMVGYSVAAKGYRLFDSTTRLVFEKRDVLFDENHDAGDDNKAAFDIFAESDGIGHDSSETGGEDSSSESSDQLESASESDEKDKDKKDKDEKDKEEQDEKDDQNEIRVGPGRPKLIRTGKPGRPKKQYNILGALVSNDVPIPATFKEAMSSPYASEWRVAQGI